MRALLSPGPSELPFDAPRDVPAGLGLRPSPLAAPLAGDDLPAEPGWRVRPDGQALVDQLLAENAALRQELARLEAYRTLAYRDPLTGLWNRRYFDERLEEEQSRSARDPRRRFSILVCDVNDLKTVNDTMGHTAGDQHICAAAQFLRDTLRAYDIICRTGGDEFACVFPDLGAVECRALVSRLRRLLETSNVTRAVPLGLSLGTASYPEQGTSVHALIEEADAAMYDDKRGQKRRTDPGMRAAI
jgi:diguanylate cyclase (GGDEF)-like protein